MPEMSPPPHGQDTSAEPEPYAEQPGDPQLDFETTQPDHARVWSRLWHAGGIDHRPLTVRQKLRRIAGLALTLALVAILFFGQQVASFATTAWNTLHRPAIAQTMCLVDGAWSPSGKNLAVLGYEGACGQSRHLAGIVNMYDSTGHQFVRQIPLDTLLAPAFKTLARAVNTDRIALGQVIWLRGGKQLAITFTLPPRSDIGETTTQFGIIVLDPAHPDSTNTHPLVYFYEIPNRPGSSYPLPDTGVLWDLKAGQGVVLSGNSLFFAYGNPLDLAYRYFWTSRDTLNPVVTPDGDDQANQPIGNPQNDQSFQIWQSGAVTAIGQTDIPYPLKDAVALWQTSFAVVSPDDRYVMAPVTMRSYLAPQIAGPAPQPPGDAGTFPMLRARDTAFALVLRTVQHDANRAAQPIIPVAWRADGRAVATFNLNDDQKVNIYDCATGYLLKSVAEPAQPAQFKGILNGLRWSPDGHHLLLLDGAILTV